MSEGRPTEGQGCKCRPTCSPGPGWMTATQQNEGLMGTCWWVGHWLGGWILWSVYDLRRVCLSSAPPTQYLGLLTCQLDQPQWSVGPRPHNLERLQQDPVDVEGQEGEGHCREDSGLVGRSRPRVGFHPDNVQLCDCGQVTQPLSASVFRSVEQG